MFLGGSREIEPAAALKGSAAELSVVRGELGSTFPHEAALMLRPLPRGAGTIPKQVLEAEVAPQLTAQDGNDGGHLGGGEAWLVEEEDEFGNKLCLVSNFSIPGSFPGEPRREAVKAFTGMNQICCVSAKKVPQSGFAPWPSGSHALLATRQNAARHPSNMCLPSAPVTWG